MIPNYGSQIIKHYHTHKNKLDFIISIIAFTMTVLSLLFLLSGCNSTQNKETFESGVEIENTSPNTLYANHADIDEATQSELDNPKQLKVFDFGYIITQEGAVDFGICIYNPNSYITALSPVITITGKDEQENILFSENTLISAITPQFQYKMSFIGNTEQVAAKEQIASVEASVMQQGDWGIFDFDENEKTTTFYSFYEQNISASDIEGIDILTGKVAIDPDPTSNNENTDIQFTSDAKDSENETTYVNVLLYDENNKIVGGYFDTVELNRNGTPEPFSIYLIDAPQYASYKLYAHPYDYSIEAMSEQK